MRVLMVIRTDASRVSGGDLVQMRRTRSALQELGVDIDAQLIGDRISSWDYDLVHIFNIQTAEESQKACMSARGHGKPVVLSPIYWDPLPGWFELAAQGHRLWKLVRQLLGPGLSLLIYSAWQHAHYSQSAVWQMQRRLLQSVDLLLPNSKMEADLIRRDFRLPARSPVDHVVPNGIDYSLYDPRPEPALWLCSQVGSGCFVLQVGRVSPEKNCLRLIEALWDVDVPIVFVGQMSPYHSEYVQRCQKKGQERGDVHFIGSVAHEQLPEIYAAASVHVLPSWRETPGLASLEAAAAGCRIVSTSIGSAQEYFGEMACYCDPANKESIRQAVLRALDSPPLEELRKQVLKRFTWEAAARATLASYAMVLKRAVK